MATLPNTIFNGDVPDANKLMENFQFCADGKGLKIGTYAELKAVGGTDPFIGFATDLRQFVGYSGNPTEGDGGLAVLAGF